MLLEQFYPTLHFMLELSTTTKSLQSHDPLTPNTTWCRPRQPPIKVTQHIQSQHATNLQMHYFTSISHTVCYQIKIYSISFQQQFLQLYWVNVQCSLRCHYIGRHYAQVSGTHNNQHYKNQINEDPQDLSSFTSITFMFVILILCLATRTMQIPNTRPCILRVYKNSLETRNYIINFEKQCCIHSTNLENAYLQFLKA